jgi:hypothetical protein
LSTSKGKQKKGICLPCGERDHRPFSGPQGVAAADGKKPMKQE